MDAAALYVLQQGVKIFFNLVIPHHVFYGVVVVDMVILLFLLFIVSLCYDPATRLNKAIAG